MVENGYFGCLNKGVTSVQVTQSLNNYWCLDLLLSVEVLSLPLPFQGKPRTFQVQDSDGEWKCLDDVDNFTLSWRKDRKYVNLGDGRTIDENDMCWDERMC